MRFDFVYWVPSVVLLTFFFPVVRPRFPFFFSTQPRLSHSIRPSRSVVTTLRLYKFYIIFMRHKVVEKATAERRKRVGVRARRCAKGKFLRVHPSRTCVTPASRGVVTWLGGANCIPSCSLDEGTKERGKTTMREGMVHRVRGSGLYFAGRTLYRETLRVLSC